MPHEELSLDSDTFHIPKFPHPVSFSKYQISHHAHMYKRSYPISKFITYGMNLNVRFYLVSKFIRYCMNLNVERWSTIVNTFYGLESLYIDHLCKVFSGMLAWSISPLLPPIFFELKQRTKMRERGKPSLINEALQRSLKDEVGRNYL